MLNGTIGRDFRQYFIPLMNYMEALSLFKTDSDIPDEAITPEYLVDNVWIVGSPDDVTEKLRQMHKDVGGFGVLLAMGHEWDPEGRLGQLGNHPGQKRHAQAGRPELTS